MSTPAWLRVLPSQARTDLTLVCFPHAGGSAGYYLPLMRPLAGIANVAVVQYPGRNDRAAERPVPSVRELARQVAGALGTVNPGRLALFGHSMGSLVAFETALLLERAGLAPAHLFVSAHKAPSRLDPALVVRGDDAAILSDLRELGGTDERVLGHRGLVSHMLPALRNDYAAIRSYRYQPGDKVSCDMTALVGDRDPRAGLGDAPAWAGLTAGDFGLRVFPGGHFYLREQRRQLASVLERRLGRLPFNHVGDGAAGSDRGGG